MKPDDSAARRPFAARLAFSIVLLVAGLAAGLAMAQEMRFFRIGTGTTGGTYFPIGGLIANAISNPPGSRPCNRGGSCGVPGLIAVAQATSGAVENIREMRLGSFESALSQADIAYWAHRGLGPYKGQAPFEELRAIANLYQEAIHLVVRADSGIESVEGLRGKRVSVGEEGSGTLVDAREVLTAYGLADKDYQAYHLKPGPAGDRLVEGEIDAFFIVGGYPVAAVSEAAARIPIRLLPLDGPEAEKLREGQPFFTSLVIAENTYPDVPATPTLSVGAQWVVRSDLDEELIYGITRALWHPSTHQLLDAGHARGASIVLSNALTGLAVPLHPGAARYYREVGLINQAAAERDGTDTVPASAPQP